MASVFITGRRWSGCSIVVWWMWWRDNERSWDDRGCGKTNGDWDMNAAELHLCGDMWSDGGGDMMADHTMEQDKQDRNRGGQKTIWVVCAFDIIIFSAT